MNITDQDREWRAWVDGRILGLRTNRYSWWAHWRELADYILPRRYRWLITPNQMARGSPINQHILDSTATLSARNLSSGMMSGISSPTRPWFKLKINRIDSTMTTPTSLWLAECERLLRLIFQESGFYNCIATWYYDLVVFGTAVLLCYEDFENVVSWVNPCLGEFYLDVDGKYRPTTFYREFTITISALIDQFGQENVPDNIQQFALQRGGSNMTREVVVGHGIEPNDDGKDFGIPKGFKSRECYWIIGGSASPQGSGASYAPGFLRKRGFFESPAIACRWDLAANDAYGRSPGMDALPDSKQLQQETRRKAQAIDKTVNPPLVADIQLKNQPASLLPGGITYIAGLQQAKHPGFASVYDTKFPIAEVTEDLNEVRERIRKIFYNDLLQTASQYETRSNVTAMEWDMRKAESLLMLGPVVGRVHNEGLANIIERVFSIAARAGILPQPPAEIQGKKIDIEYVSMLSVAQDAASSAGIERLFGMAGQLMGVDPAAGDNVDFDYGLDKYSALLNNDPKLIRTPAQLAQIRQMRQQQQQAQQQAEMAEKLAAGAKTLSETQTGAGRNALQEMTGI